MKNNSIENTTKKFNDYLYHYDFNELEDDGLFEGKLGIVYYLTYINKIYEDEKNTSTLYEILNLVLENISSQKKFISVSPCILSGLSGFGVMAHELKKHQLLGDELDNEISDINDYLLDKAIIHVQNNVFDYLGGSIGILYYFILIKDLKKADIIIHEIYNNINTQKLAFYNNTDDLYNKGLNFGLAHGISAILHIIDLYLNKNPENEQAQMIRAKCIEILSAHCEEYMIDHSKLYFPYNKFLENDQMVIHKNNRLGWCNSDLSVANTLYRSGTVSHLEKIDAEKITSETTRRRTFNTTGIQDFHFCHGTSGVAMMYKNIYDLTGKNNFREAYQYWHDQTVDFLQQDFLVLPENKMSLIFGYPAAILTINSADKRISEWSKIFLI
ncbi:lanthionine synthetase LanC family protein [Chryseobacterium indologenes]|uniref:lanthionine synthetase LanC family protein n=1 Tax=Chryseobacterium indologenes TaxID=253 RepID=UPI001625481A|nr:lanthionine synthetase LanC family protein [Chryseobacterium indologenes]